MNGGMCYPTQNLSSFMGEDFALPYAEFFLSQGRDFASPHALSLPETIVERGISEY
jgi:hypothetical protein